MKNVTNQRMDNLIEIVSAQNTERETSGLVDLISSHIEEVVVGTGKLFKLDVYSLYMAGGVSLEETTIVTNELLNGFALENRLVTTQESEFVYNVECKQKVMTLLSLNKIQKMIYDVFPASPDLAKKAMEKLQDEERSLVSTVLTFER